MTVGYFSPLPPARTGVADYSAALLGPLGELCEVRLNSDDAQVSLYHLGNNQLHRDIYERALRRPGVAVLHDAVLHHFFLGSLERAAYIEEFVYNYGEFEREHAAALWDRRKLSALAPEYFRYALVRRVAERSLAVVVHNPAAARIVRKHAPLARVVEIPHAFVKPTLPSDAEVQAWRGRHGIAADTTLFGVFGYLRESKRLPAVLAAFRRVRAEGANAALLVAGEFGSSDLERAVAPQLEAAGALRVPYAPEAEFWLMAAATDVCVNLRYPAAGETSGIAIRMMGIGKPVLMSAGEETSRHPEDACVRVDTGLAEAAMLAEYMGWLTANRAAARMIGTRAAVHIQAQHSPAASARAYAEVLSSFS